jgi:hypothetical protein
MKWACPLTKAPTSGGFGSAVAAFGPQHGLLAAGNSICSPPAPIAIE